VINLSERVYTIEEIKKILSSLLENMPVYQVILFGSYAKNEADSSSDLDFVLDTRSTLMGFKLLSLISQIEDAFQKQIDAFEKTEIIENSKADKEIKQAGVVVYEK
jgi:predicted nucleotidyltransferase